MKEPCRARGYSIGRAILLLYFLLFLFISLATLVNMLRAYPPRSSLEYAIVVGSLFVWFGIIFSIYRHNPTGYKILYWVGILLMIQALFTLFAQKLMGVVMIVV